MEGGNALHCIALHALYLNHFSKSKSRSSSISSKRMEAKFLVSFHSNNNNNIYLNKIKNNQ